MSGEQLGAIAGTVLSLIFSYIPGVREWFDGLEHQQKQSLMGISLIVVAGAVFGISCAGLLDLGVVCTQAGLVEFIQVLIAALVANQGVYLITRRK